MLLTHHLASGGGPAENAPRRRRREVMSKGPRRSGGIRHISGAGRADSAPAGRDYRGRPARADRDGAAALVNNMSRNESYAGADARGKRRPRGRGAAPRAG